MKKVRFTRREHGVVEVRMGRLFRSSQVQLRDMRLLGKRCRGVLTPIIRGCREPDWLQDKA